MPSGLDLDALIRAHRDDLWWYLRALGCEPATADDLVQETFLALLQSGFEERSTRETFGWLRTTARNRYVSLLRRTRRETPLDLAGTDRLWDRFRPDERLDALKSALEECLEELTARAREAVLLRYRRGRKTREIAAATHARPATVTKLLQRAKRSLRECLERKVPR